MRIIFSRIRPCRKSTISKGYVSKIRNKTTHLGEEVFNEIPNRLDLAGAIILREMPQDRHTDQIHFTVSVLREMPRDRHTGQIRFITSVIQTHNQLDKTCRIITDEIHSYLQLQQIRFNENNIRTHFVGVVIEGINGADI